MLGLLLNKILGNMIRCILNQLKKHRNNSGTISPITNNQSEEISYFSSYVLPVSQKANLQTALDTYGSVRLEKGDYSGVNIVMRTGQKLYGNPSFLSRVSNITIASGSKGVVLEDLFPVDKTITIQAGGVVSECIFKSIKWATLVGENVMFENNTLINYAGNIKLDCSNSGYFRNNKIIRHQSGGTNLLILKGNNNTPSYGNVHLWSNYLTPHGDTTELDGLQTHTFVGLDAESWNYNNLGTRAMLYGRSMNKLKIADLNGGSAVTYKTPVFDIECNEMVMLNKILSDNFDSVSANTNMFILKGGSNYTRKSGTNTGFSFNVDDDVYFNGSQVTQTITNPTDITKISETISGTPSLAWTRPIWETLPDPLGVNWRTERVGKPDSTSYIQGLIDTNGIANLPEGIFYISSTLTIPSNGGYGIIGKGTGKTVICGLTDDFNLISIKGSADGNIVLSYLTLQGGDDGFYASTDYGGLNISYQSIKYVVFRNQNNAMHLKRTGGFDNCFLDNVSFVGCNKGFYQEPTPGNAGEGNSAYVDKTMFYNSQFIGCNTAFSMLATRPNNLNAWVNCKFDGGNTALDLLSNNGPIIANCDITNYSGTHVIRSNVISIYNTNIYGNNVSVSTINSLYTGIEGCNFLDNSPVFSPVIYNPINTFILNSTMKGNVVAVIPLNRGFYPQSAIFSNSTLVANPTISKLLTSIKDGGVPNILINTTPNPYPQLLVTQ